eukprot:6110171-Pyramimonas_sp.AAC.1
MEFIASALNAGNPESEALQDKWLLSCKLVANVWANPQKYIDFAVPEAPPAAVCLSACLLSVCQSVSGSSGSGLSQGPKAPGAFHPARSAPPRCPRPRSHPPPLTSPPLHLSTSSTSAPPAPPHLQPSNSPQRLNASAPAPTPPSAPRPSL